MTTVTGSLDSIADQLAEQDRQAQARQMIAQGLSERQVANQLGVSPSTVNRWKQAAAAAGQPMTSAADAPGAPAPQAMPAAPAAAPAGEPGDASTSATPEPDEAAETLTALRDRQDKLAAQHGALLDQAQAAREQIEDLDSQRIEALAGGGDSSRFAAGRAPLEAEHARLAQDAAVVGRWLEECAAEITRREAGRAERDRQAAEQAARAAAIAEGDQLAPVAAAALRAAVLGEVTPGELVRVVAALVALEPVAGRSWDEEILPPQLQGARDGWHLQVCALWRAARSGDAAGCQAMLAALGGQWADRDRGEFARDREAAAERARQAQEEANANMSRGRRVGGPQFLPERPGMGAARPPQLAQANVNWQGGYSDGPRGAGPAG
jgi:Homeodomain-like domain